MHAATTPPPAAIDMTFAAHAATTGAVSLFASPHPAGTAEPSPAATKPGASSYSGDAIRSASGVKTLNITLQRPPTASWDAGARNRKSGGNGGGNNGGNTRTDVTLKDIKTGYVSPLDDQWVGGTRGVVTMVKRNGYYVQNEHGGIFVFQAKKSPAEMGIEEGDELEFTGKVDAFVGKDPRDQTNLKLPQFMAFPDSVKILSKGNAKPEPLTLGTGGVIPPKDWVSEETFRVMNENGAGNHMEHEKTPYAPGRDALAFYHNLVGTLVRLEDAVVVGATDDKMYFYVAPNGGERLGLKSPRGGARLTEKGMQTEVLKIDVASLPQETRRRLTVGDRITTDLVGVMEYSFGAFQVRLTQGFEIERGNLEPEKTTLAGDADHMTFANYNVENLDPSDGVRIDDIARQIVENMNAPDVISLQEVQDNDGAEDSGNTAADKTLNQLIAAIKKLRPDLNYEYAQIDPVNNGEGGQPGGNIRVAYLVNVDRVTLNRHGDAGPKTEIEITEKDGQAALNHNPVRLGTKAPSYAHSRKPLVMEVEFNGEKVYFINAHLSSKRGDSTELGILQPPERHSEANRVEQAREINEVVKRLLKADPNARIVVSGDMNEHHFRKPMQTLQGKELINAPTMLLDSAMVYTYNFRGHSQDLDQLFVSAAVMAGENPLQVQYVHFNSEFPKIKHGSFVEPGGRSGATENKQVSDHDGIVGRMRIPAQAGGERPRRVRAETKAERDSPRPETPPRKPGRSTRKAPSLR